MDALLLVGLIGSLFSLVAFSLNQTDRLSNKSLWYDGMNAIAGLFLLVYAFHLQAWPFVLTNTVWFLLSTRDVLVTVSKRKG